MTYIESLIQRTGILGGNPIALAQDTVKSNLEAFATATKLGTLKLASFLTEPICKVREYFYTFYLLDSTCNTTAEKVAKVAVLIFGIAVYALLTPFTAPLGVILRFAVATLDSKPYIYLKAAKDGKQLPAHQEITVVSHNQCYMPAGYSITDGQVTPPSDRKRMNDNIEKIRSLDPDIICLYEVADICDAAYLTSKFSDYPFVIPMAGVRAIGPSSMMYVASKYEIIENSIEFNPFVKGTEITGRAQFSEKGVLSFDIANGSNKKAFATIISTHLQHSEIPAKPEQHEIESRTAQMKKIAEVIRKKVNEDKNVIFTGDLNQAEDEITQFLSTVDQNTLKLTRPENVCGLPTWGGDEWCAKLMKKGSSPAQVLDYTFIGGKARSIVTQIKKTGYSGSEFRPKALSDHYLLYSTITVSA